MEDNTIVCGCCCKEIAEKNGEDGKYVVEAEVFGKEIDMWLRSQGEDVTILG
ncbi:MAG: hypothetical protein NC412_12435 [Roseburia sp.]|nr:hypothetical protein [Roseburia sp.]MCM1279524.1 hypothetical protein [Robinsoniella sp.]